MSLASRSVAIIGSGGIIGKQLIALLKADTSVDRVVVIDPTRPTGLPSGTKCHEIDLMDDDAVDRISDVIDQMDVGTLVYMGYLSDRLYPQEHQANEVARVIDVLTRRSVPKVIFTSTTAVYGALPTDPTHLSEDTPRAEQAHSAWIRDKVAAEKTVEEFCLQNDSLTTVFRFAPVLGPSVRNFLSEYLYRTAVPTVKGTDPQVQVIHETDAAGAYCNAIDNDFDGVFNIVADGALPLSVALRIGRRRPAPVAELGSYPLTQLLWDDEIIETPEILVDLFKYVWVADGRKALELMHFHPRRSTRETVEEFYKSRLLQAQAAQ